jgi:hypothetical protein
MYALIQRSTQLPLSERDERKGYRLRLRQAHAIELIRLIALLGDGHISVSRYVMQDL